MKLLVKPLGGGNFHLDVEPSAKIASVKEQIQESQGHAVDLQKLIFSGKILDNDKTIEEYGIQEKDFLVVMVSKVRGGTNVAQGYKACEGGAEGGAQGRGAEGGAGGAEGGDQGGACVRARGRHIRPRRGCAFGWPAGRLVLYVASLTQCPVPSSKPR